MSLLDLIYPRFCISCGAKVRLEPMHLCWNCQAEVEKISFPFCKICGDPVDGIIESEYTCSWCSRKHPDFDLARSAARFRGSLKEAIHSYKYKSNTHMSRDFVRLLTACVRVNYSDYHYDAVTYVPLHPKKERERTYNQSYLLAKGLAKDLKCPIFRGAILRNRVTRSQASQKSSSARKTNVSGAFTAGKTDWINGRRMLLVDDVMTTGATVNECAKVMKDAGAVSVHVATVARG